MLARDELSGVAHPRMFARAKLSGIAHPCMFARGELYRSFMSHDACLPTVVSEL